MAVSVPHAKKVFHEVTMHGDTRVDFYHWLRGKHPEDWKAMLDDTSLLDKEVRTYLEAENAYYKDHIAEFTELTDAIRGELFGRVVPDDASVPTKDGEWLYWIEYKEGGNYPVRLRKSVDGKTTEVLFDGDSEAEGKKFFNIAAFTHSPDHRLIAYSLDAVGSERYTIHVRDIATGKEVDRIEGTSGGITWGKNSDHIFYTELDENKMRKVIRCHKLETPQSSDPLIYRELDDEFSVGVSKTFSGDYILVDTANKETSETHFLPSDATDASKLRLIRKREEGIEYEVSHKGDDFYFMTNRQGAVEFKVMKAPISDLRDENWTDVVTYNPKSKIVSFENFENYMVWEVTENGLPRVVVSDYDGNQYDVKFEDEAYDVSCSTGYEFDSDKLRLFYQTPVRPMTTLELDMGSRAQTVLKEKQLPNGHDPDNYCVERKFITARDGVQVPVTILRRKDTPIDGTAPLYQYGYGSYGVIIEDDFANTPISFIDRGVIYAYAHIRGGGKLGQQWYLDGKKEHKMRTFYDFIDVTEALVAEGYGEAGKVCIEGRSAGGMLMGQVCNLRPDLYKGVIAGVPFVDVLSTILDGSLPLTPGEWDEWGNPNTSAETYHLLKSYSPYDQIVEGQTYPSILAAASLADYRVTYWEPAKWIAKLREVASPESGKFLLYTNMTAGHGGSSGRYDHLEERAPQIAYAINQFEEAGYDMSMRTKYPGTSETQKNTPHP